MSKSRKQKQLASEKLAFARHIATAKTKNSGKEAKPRVTVSALLTLEQYEFIMSFGLSCSASLRAAVDFTMKKHISDLSGIDEESGVNA
jgi:hypothetical protein